jgi:hypothetical protein
MKVEDARRKARDELDRMGKGKPPVRSGSAKNTLREALELYAAGAKRDPRAVG